MKTQLTSLGVLGAGVMLLGILQACAPTEPMLGPTVAETAPARSADTPAGELAPPPADASTSAPASPAVPSAVEAVPPSLITAETRSDQALPPARSITDLTVQRTTNRVVVLITGDGDLTYDVTMLSGNRLVIDLLNVVNTTKRQAVPVRHQFIRQIRIGAHQFPQAKVRLVLDLGRTVPYTIEKTGAQLRVTLSEQAPAVQTPQETHTATRSTPAPAEVGAGGARVPVAPPNATGEGPPPDRVGTGGAIAGPPPDRVGAGGARVPVAPSNATGEGPPPATNVARMSPRRSVPVPGRLTFLDPLTPLAQLKQDQPGELAMLGGTERFTGKRISLDFQDAEISSVLRLIANVSGLNMVVGEAVKAKVTLKLLNVPWDQALDLVLKLNNLGQIREGNILWIDTLANITKLRDDAARAKEATLKAEELVTRIIYLNYSDAAKTIDVAKSNLSPRGEIKVDSRTNSLVVRDVAENLSKVEKMVHSLDQRTPQVQIEARIVQASKAFARGLGIQWGISQIRAEGGTQGPISINLGTDQAIPVSNAAFGVFNNRYLVNLPSGATGVSIPSSTIGFAIGRFLGTTGTLDMQLSAGEALSQTKIISAPKVITLDNKPAKIEQGDQVPFQTTSLQGTQTTFVDATLSLNVTPHVIPHANTVRLEIKVTKNSIGASQGAAGPAIDKKETTTEILLRDGETTVLGGIFEEDRSDSSSGIPWFNRIPFLGWLFKNEGVRVNQTELLVFITPIIVKE
jgi:type IV pilus assembly protein PilQ